MQKSFFNYLTLDSYKTIETTSTSELKEKGSKFIAHLFPISSDEDFKKKLNSFKEQYNDARHFCYAYKTLADGSNYRVNDDGEPTNSAGKPILGQLESFEITYCACIVIRYFGGVKLGVGGLIKAFKEVTKQAIVNNTLTIKEITILYELRFNYAQMNKVMSMIKKLQLKIVFQELNIESIIHLECPINIIKILENSVKSNHIQFKILEH